VEVEAMTRSMRPRPLHQRGVTLVELVVVMTLLGVMGSIGATLVTRIVAGQQDTRGRLALAQAADGAFARVQGDLENALPNSVRVSANAAGTWIEWVPVQDAARYRQAPDTVSGTPGDILDLGDATDNAFDVVGTALATPAAGAQIAWANLGTTESDVYAGTNRRAGLAVSNAGRHVAFTAAGALPADASTARFFIVGTPLTLACVAQADGTQQLRRYSGYGWKAVQPVSSSDLAGATTVVLLDKLSACSAAYGSALANIGLLNLRVGLGDGVTAARMNFMQQLALDNTP
jgi:MSHA biogenesis protein MshO